MSSLPASQSEPTSVEGLASLYAQRIVAALPLNWVLRISMHDCQGHVCWQSPGEWQPDERGAASAALERFGSDAAPPRADYPLPQQRTAVLLRAADPGNAFRGFVMLILDSRRLRGRGTSVTDLPVPVPRAAQEWATRLAAPLVHPRPTGVPGELSGTQIDRLLTLGGAADEPEVEKFFARLRAFPLALVAQALTPLQRAAGGTPTRRYEVFLREAAAPLGDSAPVSLLRAADDRGLGTVLDRRVAGALAMWLAARRARFQEQPAQFSINLSASSLSDPNLLRYLELCIAKSGIDPALLAFEADQSFWRRNRLGLERLCRGLEALGAGVIVDNGTLNDDLAELLTLPAIRMLKIDRRLTHDLAASRVSRMRVAGVNQIAHEGGVLTVAKQIDDPLEQEPLRALGVDFLQGRSTSVPVSLDALEGVGC